MTFELTLLLVPLVLVVLLAGSHGTLRSDWYRFVRLPALVRENGWLMKRRMPWQSRKGGELPGSGSVPWTYVASYAECEVLGTYAHRPVHGIEFGIPRKSYIGQGKPSWIIDRYLVAASAQPFGNFHGAPGGRPVSGARSHSVPTSSTGSETGCRTRTNRSRTKVRAWCRTAGEAPQQRRLFRALEELTDAG